MTVATQLHVTIPKQFLLSQLLDMCCPHGGRITERSLYFDFASVPKRLRFCSMEERKLLAYYRLFLGCLCLPCSYVGQRHQSGCNLLCYRYAVFFSPFDVVYSTLMTTPLKVSIWDMILSVPMTRNYHTSTPYLCSITLHTILLGSTSTDMQVNVKYLRCKSQ